MTTKISAINVVEYADDDLLGVTSYEGTPEGKTEAENHFRQCAMENGATEEEVEEFIAEGYYETGTYQLFLK